MWVGHNDSGTDYPIQAEYSGLSVGNSQSEHIFFSMLRCRGAGGMMSSFSFPIVPRHSDLARPRQSRSRPLPAQAAMRSDHAIYPFYRRRDGDVLQCCTRHADGHHPGATRDRFSASGPSFGLRTIFQVDALAARSRRKLSCAHKAIRTGDRMACRGHSPLDRAARSALTIEGRPRVARPKRPYVRCVSNGPRRGCDSPQHGNCQQIAADNSAFSLMRISRVFPGDFSWQRGIRRLNIQECVRVMGDASHAG